MHYRPATNADGPAVESLVFSVLAEYGLATEPMGMDADMRDLDGFYLATGGWFGVWTDDTGTIQGTAGLRKLDVEACELRKMYLHASMRGKGHGRAILEHAIVEAKRLGFKRITLETASVLNEATRLYEKYGFRRVPCGAHGAARCDIAMTLVL